MTRAILVAGAHRCLYYISCILPSNATHEILCTSSISKTHSFCGVEVILFFTLCKSSKGNVPYCANIFILKKDLEVYVVFV